MLQHFWCIFVPLLANELLQFDKSCCNSLAVDYIYHSATSFAENIQMQHLVTFLQNLCMT